MRTRIDNLLFKVRFSQEMMHLQKQLSQLTFVPQRTGYVPGGPAIVGEAGPEVVLTKKGTAFLKLPQLNLEKERIESIALSNGTCIRKVRIDEYTHTTIESALEKLDEVFASNGVAIIIKQDKQCIK